MATASTLGGDPPRRRKQLHEPFSESHPIPQVEAYFTDLAKPVKPQENEGAYTTASWFGGGSTRDDEKQKEDTWRRDQSTVSDEDPEEHPGVQNKKDREKSKKRDLHRGSSRIVQDPVTLRKIQITNTDASFDDAMDPAKSRGRSVLQQDFPPIEWDSIARETRAQITSHAAAAIVPAIILPYISSFLISITILSCWWYIVYYHYDKVTQNIFDDYKYDAERRRGESTIRERKHEGMDINTDKVMGRSDGMPKAGGDETGIQEHRESVEWANQLLASLWPIIDPSLFTSLTDMLEDVMQASMPKAINTVRITDLSQGNHPLRIISIRPLDDAETQDAPEHAKDMNPAEEAMSGEEHQGEGGSAAKHVNLEVAFAYRALPIKGHKVYSKAKNMHILIDFGLGMKGVFGKSLPIWVEIRGIVGTMRMRLEMTAKPPFVKHATVTLCGLPKIEIAAIPMVQTAWKLNAMNLPLIRTFISNSISTAMYEYVSPQSLTVDLGQMLVGDDIKKDTLAMGLVVITIHEAEVKAADIGGTSDPYVTVSLAKFGKPLFSTRIIMAETHPVWEATTVILIRPEAFRVKERIALQIWDSDRLTADDELGRVEVDLLELYKHRGKMTRRTSSLSHLDKAVGKAIPGSIDYSIGFFEKVPPRRCKKNKDIELSDLPEDLRNNPEMKVPKAKSMNETEELITNTPPDPDFPSGILSIQIHEGFDFEREDLRPTGGSHNTIQFKHPPSAEGANREEGDTLPSSYCRIRINDDTVFQTRVKPISSMPFFNTSHEAFIRDFNKTTVTIVARDSKNREHDPLLGMIDLKLGDVFRTASQTTGCFPLTGGAGYGRLRISLLFRSVGVKLPPTLHGFDTATVMVQGTLALVDTEPSLVDAFRKSRIEMRTSHGRCEIGKGEKAHDTEAIEFANQKTAVPVKRRFSSPLIIAFSDSRFGIKHKPMAEAVVWLLDIPDSSRRRIHLPVYRAKDFARLEQNYWTPFDFEGSSSKSPSASKYHTSQSHNESLRRAQEKLAERGLVQVATLSIDLTILPGLSSAHRNTIRKDPRQRVVMEGFDWAIMSGLRTDPVKTDHHDTPDDDGDRSATRKSWNVDQQESEGSSDGDAGEDGGKSLEEFLTAKRRGDDRRRNVPSSSPPTSLEDGNAIFKQNGHARRASGASWRSGRTGDLSNEGHPEDETEKGWKQRYHEWKDKQHNLHLRRRGIMQAKPMRTGAWLKDCM